jgi:hypothetical protein
MALYAVIMYAPESATPREPTAEEQVPYDRHAEELAARGVMTSAFALAPARTAMSIRGSLVTDGPFAETKEVIAGLYVIDVADLAAALDVARRNPILKDGGGLEVRPLAGWESRELPRTRGIAATDPKRP